MKTVELDLVLATYKESFTPSPLKINIKNMANLTSIDLPIEVEILLPTESYWNIKVRLDLWKTDNWKTDKENIDALILKAKYIRSNTQEK